MRPQSKPLKTFGRLQIASPRPPLAALEWLIRAAQGTQGILRASNAKGLLKLFPEPEIDDGGQDLFAVLGTVRDIKGCKLTLLIDRGDHADWALYYYFGFSNRRVAREAALASNNVFPLYLLWDVSETRVPEYDKPILELRPPRSEHMFAVDSSAAVLLRRPPDSLLIADIAHFFYAVLIAWRKPKKLPLRVLRYGPRGDPRMITPPGLASVVSIVRCPRCKSVISDYGTNCYQCEWRSPENDSPLLGGSSPYGYEQSDT